MSLNVANLLESALRIEKLLDAYIEIHDEVFAFRWAKLLPWTAWFAPDDYHLSLVILKSLEEALARIRSAISAHSTSDADTSELLIEYSIALEAAMRQLRAICVGLDVKARRSDRYSWSEYKRDCDEYQKRVDAYRTVGVALNTRLQRLEA